MATLESTIHSRWSAKTTLHALLPADSVFTGDQRGIALPYASISRESSSKAAQSNYQRYDLTTIRFAVFHSSHDLGLAIAEQIAKKTAATGGFHQDGFSISGGGHVLNMVVSNQFNIEDENAVWMFVVDFEVTYRLP